MKFDLLFENLLNKYTKEDVYVLVSGIHGDEPAGNEAVKYFKNRKNIYIISNVNKTGKRRLNGKDLNRHFDSEDSTAIQDNILNKILEINPKLVIDLHEDDEVDSVYAYCTKDIEDNVKKALSDLGVKLAKRAHGDNTDDGVIVNGKQPYKNTLEKALKKRNISYCAIETPSSSEELQKRVDHMIKIINHLIS